MPASRRSALPASASGIGNVFATTIATIGRNPSIQARVAGLMWIGFALVEAIGLFALLVAFMVLFG